MFRVGAIIVTLATLCRSILLNNNLTLVTVKEFRELVDLIYEENRLRNALEHDVGNLQQRLVKSEADYTVLQGFYGNLSRAYGDLRSSHDEMLRRYTVMKRSNQSIHASLSSNHADIVQLQQTTGRVSAFTAWSPSSTSVTEPVKFSTVLTNIGSHYDSSSGKFTCQYPGLYVFTLNLYRYASTSYSDLVCYIKRNGSNKIRAYIYPYSSAYAGYYESTQSLVMHLSRGDIVTIGSCSGHIQGYSSFSGYLLRAD